MTRKLHVAAIVTVVMTFFAMIVGAISAMAAEIKLMSTAALTSPMRELAPQFERATGHRVIMDFGSVMPLKRRIDAGEAFDCVVLSPAMIDELIKQGKIAADTRAPFVRTGLGMGVPKGAPKPDISSVEAFKHTLLTAKSIGYEPEAQPGTQFMEILERLGIAPDVRSRLKAFAAPVAGSGSGEMQAAIGRREVEIAVSSIGAISGLPVADLVGSFPSEIQRYIEFAVGTSATTKEPEAAKAFLRFLLSSTAASVLKAKGFEHNTAAENNEKLYGVWKLVSYDLEDAATKERKSLFGQHPKGYLILLPSGRMMSIITAEGRKAPQTDAERSDAFRSLLAYSGRFRVDGNKFVTKVDAAWNETWVGTDQERTYKLDGDTLYIISMTQPNVNFGGRMMTGILSWERDR